jgi:hypothetical protein
MMSLMLLILFALLVGRCAGACLRVTNRSLWHLRRGAERRGEPLPERPPEPALPRVEETPLERLQGQFARGDISVEQYERELNRLYGIRG